MGVWLLCGGNREAGFGLMIRLDMDIHRQKLTKTEGIVKMQWKIPFVVIKLKRRIVASNDYLSLSESVKDVE